MTFAPQPKPETAKAAKRKRRVWVERARRSMKLAVRLRDIVCQRCGRKTGLEVHHVEKLSQGGADTAENGVLLCARCHRGPDGEHA